MKSPREGHAELIPISRSEFDYEFRNGSSLPIRYYDSYLFQNILNNPFSPSLKDLFGNEWLELPPGEKYFGFSVDHWLAYHCENRIGFYNDYEKAQLELGFQFPIQPRIFSQFGWNEYSSNVIEAFVLWIEALINRDPYLKKNLLIDMMIIASKT